MKNQIITGSALIALSSGAYAAALAIDIQPTGGTTAAGFQAYEATNQDLTSLTLQNFAAFGTSVGLQLTVANLPDANLDFRAVARNGAATDANNDWLGADTRAAGTDVTLSITVTNLPAGAYTWLSSHHDGGTGSTNGNLDGQADYNFTDSAGSTGLTANGIDFSRQDQGQPVSTFGTAFTSDGTTPITLDIIMDNGQGTPDDTNSLFAFASSLTITEVPEPSTAILGSFGLLALLRRRR